MQWLGAEKVKSSVILANYGIRDTRD